MNRKKFNRDMDTYLRSRREVENTSTNFKVTVTRRETAEQVVDNQVQIQVVDDDQPGFFARLAAAFAPREEAPRDELTHDEMTRLQEMNDPDESEQPVEEEFEDIEERPSFLRSLATFFGFGPPSDHEHIKEFDPEEYEDPTIDYNSVKETLQITHTWLEELSPKKKKEFKESGDFDRYKELLSEMGLIK